MDSIDRRNLLIGTGLALTLAGCGPKGEGNSTEETPGKVGSPPLKMDNFDASWNHGDAPWNGHPGGAAFRSAHLAVLYLEFVIDSGEPKLLARRAHFDGTAAADLTPNMALVEQAITHLNGLQRPSPSPSPTPTPNPSPAPTIPGWKFYEGIGGFSFKQATHLIIYLKNSGVEYGSGPIWFGTKLQDGSPAAKNESFFNAVVQSNLPTTVGGPTGFVYVQNYFHKNYATPAPTPTPTPTPGDYREIGKENILYAMNINVRVKSLTERLMIPITIDPDTGNMGSGSGDGTPI